MKISKNKAAMLFALAIAAAGSTTLAIDKCELALGGNQAMLTVGKWRLDNTANIKTKKGSVVVPTNAAREQKIQKINQDMHATIFPTKGEADVPYYEIVEAPSASLKETQAHEYLTGRYAKYDVTTGGEPVLRATMLLPVSGHVGAANARKWAKTDTYSVWAEVDGKTYDLVVDAKSLDIVTHQDIEIPLVRGKEVKVFYLRSGNSIEGFMEGRVMGFTWNGK